jgi:hypothetical protein
VPPCHVRRLYRQRGLVASVPAIPARSTSFPPCRGPLWLPGALPGASALPRQGRAVPAPVARTRRQWPQVRVGAAAWWHCPSLITPQSRLRRRRGSASLPARPARPPRPDTGDARWSLWHRTHGAPPPRSFDTTAVVTSSRRYVRSAGRVVLPRILHCLCCCSVTPRRGTRRAHFLWCTASCGPAFDQHGGGFCPTPPCARRARRLG